jgi:hypothetical protein
MPWKSGKEIHMEKQKEMDNEVSKKWDGTSKTRSLKVKYCRIEL